jgi:pseudaminic acid cytidylyltransferase
MRVAVIPARGGSRRIPRKNVEHFKGMPMISYPIRAAIESRMFELIMVSTDDLEIASVAFDYGAVPVPRPLDDGTTGTNEIAGRALDKLQISGGTCCVIYPCSPLLTSELLKEGFAELLKPHHQCYVRSVTPAGVDAGCFYWGWIRSFRDRVPMDEYNLHDFALPAERAIDINTPEDWAAAERMYEDLHEHR